MAQPSPSTAFLAHRHELLAYIRSLSRDPQEAEDLLQDTWVTLEESLRNGTVIQCLPAWCRTVARNAWIRRRQAARRERPDDLAVATALEQAFAASERDSTPWSRHLAALDRCLEAADAAGRRLLARRYADGADTGTLAAEFRIDEDTLLRRLSRLRLRLRQCVDQRLAKDT